MDIDFIKWKVELADGFEWLEHYMSHERNKQSSAIKFSTKYNTHTVRLDKYEYSITCPILLKRAIEGLNRQPFPSKWFIDMCANHYYVGYGEDYVFEPDGEGETAMESALQYIYEQEKKG